MNRAGGRVQQGRGGPRKKLPREFFAKFCVGWWGVRKQFRKKSWPRGGLRKQTKRQAEYGKGGGLKKKGGNHTQEGAANSGLERTDWIKSRKRRKVFVAEKLQKKDGGMGFSE